METTPTGYCLDRASVKVVTCQRGCTHCLSMHTLEASNHGLKIGEINCGNITLADGLSLEAISSDNLDRW